ncbi:MAG: heavy-metal-associated domain-containing protein [Chloroflexi bacterium]|nr:heavy-metal-associated domain-containing protein [Chloroflexota bacterium]
MDRKTFEVPNIGCDNCVRTIKNELGSIAGVKQVEGVTATRMITVEWDDPANWQQIVAALKEIDYAPAEA